MQTILGDRILEVVKAKPQCTLEEITHQLPDLHWTDVFREVVTLIRFGHLELNQSSLGLTTTLQAR